MLTSILQFEQQFHHAGDDDDASDSAPAGAADAAGVGGGGGGCYGDVVARVLHSLAMLHYLLRDVDKATASRFHSCLLRPRCGAYRRT